MSYSKDGFEEKTPAEIIEEKESRFADIFDIMNNSVSDVLWQYMKLNALEEHELMMLNKEMVSEMSIQTAQGVFLDKWGIECGITRKGATKSEGYVLVGTDMSSRSSDVTIPEGTSFTNNVNTYYSDIADVIPKTLEMTKNQDGESNDYFPTEVEYVGSVEKIIDSDGDEIDTSEYSLNQTYNNHIEWNAGSSVIANQTYVVYFDGIVKKRIEVSSELEGEDTTASADTITSSADLNQSSYSINNPQAIDGGSEEESDESYRDRLLQARRRTFTLGSVRDIILGLEGVRSCKVYQTVGTDQTSVSNWDSYSYSEVDISGTQPVYSQEFVPGDQIATLGRITLRGRPVNDPPALYCGLKRDIDATSSGTYLDYAKLESYEIEHVGTGIRDLEFPVKYNGMDKTKTYRFDVWCEAPESAGFDWSTNHWKLQTTDEGYVRGTGDSRGEFLKNNVGQGSGIDFVFKTSFNGAGFNVTLATEDGYGFENIEENIDTYLDYVEEGGYSPICIQSYIEEAETVEIDIKGKITISELGDFNTIRAELEENIESYLEGLYIGDNVKYAQIFSLIMNHEFVENLKELQIRRGTASYDTTDIGIENNEVADLGVTSFQQ